jgi:hypothetical protein
MDHGTAPRSERGSTKNVGTRRGLMREREGVLGEVELLSANEGGDRLLCRKRPRRADKRPPP